jgi:hypothetical protein
VLQSCQYARKLNSPDIFRYIRSNNWLTDWLTDRPTDSMEHSSPWEANSHSSSQEITRLLLNPKVHYHDNKSLPLVSVLSQIDPFLTFPFILMSSWHVRLGIPSDLLFQISEHNFICISPWMRAACPTHLVFDLITILIFCEAYKLWCSQYQVLLNP